MTSYELKGSCLLRVPVHTHTHTHRGTHAHTRMQTLTFHMKYAVTFLMNQCTYLYGYFKRARSIVKQTATNILYRRHVALPNVNINFLKTNYIHKHIVACPFVVMTESVELAL
jgi:hypothetical protein